MLTARRRFEISAIVAAATMAACGSAAVNDRAPENGTAITAPTTTGLLVTTPAVELPTTGFSSEGRGAITEVVTHLPVDPAAAVVAVDRTNSPAEASLALHRDVPYLEIHVRIRSTEKTDVLYAQWLASLTASAYQIAVGDESPSAINGAMLQLETTDGPLDWHGHLETPELGLTTEASQQTKPTPMTAPIEQLLQRGIVDVAGTPSVESLSTAEPAGLPAAVLTARLAAPDRYGASLHSFPIFFGDANEQVVGFFVFLQDDAGATIGAVARLNNLESTSGTFDRRYIPPMDPNAPA